MLFNLKFFHTNEDSLFLKADFRKVYKTECLMIILGKPTKDRQIELIILILLRLCSETLFPCWFRVGPTHYLASVSLKYN